MQGVRTASHRIADIGNRHVYMPWRADPSACQPTTLPADPCTCLLEYLLPHSSPTCPPTSPTHLPTQLPNIHVSNCLPTQLSSYPTTTHPTIHISNCPTTQLPIYLPTYLPTFHPTYPHTHIPTYPPLYAGTPLPDIRGKASEAARFPVNIPREKGKNQERTILSMC